MPKLIQSHNSGALSYASYDFSNSGFLVIFQSFLFPLVLATSIDKGSENLELWPWLVAISSILAIIAAPFVGRIADTYGKWKVFTICVITVGFVSSLVPLVYINSYVILAIGFIIFNVVFELTQSLYDSFLLNYRKGVSNITELSTFAWGFGYLGGALFVAIYFVLDANNVSENIMLFLFGILYFILSVPAIYAFRRYSDVILEVKQVNIDTGLLSPKAPIPWKQIFIYWIIADCVAAVMYFLPIFMKIEIGLSTKEIGILLISGQLLAFPMTIMMGRIATKLGLLKGIQLSLLIWLLSILALYFASSKTHMIYIILLISLVIGATQALLRAHFASRIENQKSGEGLGFYAIAQKSASVVSPIIIGASVSLTGSLRPGFFLLGVLILVGLTLSRKLDFTRLN